MTCCIGDCGKSLLSWNPLRFAHFGKLVLYLLRSLCVNFLTETLNMSALTKIEFERDTHCVNISLFAQCRALINEGMATEIDGLIERSEARRSQTE